MKILAMGDFHGKLSPGFGKVVKTEKIDLIVSIGDYAPFHYRDLWFKHCYGKDVELWEVIGKKKYEKLVMEDLRRAECVLKKLNKLGVPVLTVLGNMDWPAVDDIMDVEEVVKKSMPNYDKTNLFSKRLRKYKNIYRFDYKALKFEGYVFIGMRGHSIPGDTKSKAFKLHKDKLKKLFEKYKKENKKGRVVFVSHNIVYNTNLDKISMEAIRNIEKNIGKKFSKDELKKKRHYGSKMARQITDKYQPVLHFGGHIHEGRGKQMVKNTLCINPGEASSNQYSIVDIDNGKIKSVKLFK